MVSLSIPHHGVVHREEELKVNQEGKGRYSLELTLREEWVGQKKEEVEVLGMARVRLKPEG